MPKGVGSCVTIEVQMELSPKSPVTGGATLLCDGAVGAMGAGVGAGLFSWSEGAGCKPDPSTPFPYREPLWNAEHTCAA